jgi:hypothetical protein
MRTIRVVALVEYRSGRREYVTWSTSHPSGPAAFKRRIRAQYAQRPDVRRVTLGNYLSENSYGAH